MQTNVTCSLPRKRKFPEQKLSVLLEVMNHPKRPSTRLKLHSFPSRPTGIYCCLVTGIGWLAPLFPAGPLLVCPAFRCPGCLLSLRRPLWSPSLSLPRVSAEPEEAPLVSQPFSSQAHFLEFFLYEPF